MTLKEVKCNNCGKNFLVELRKYNEYTKYNWNFYCSKECKYISRSKVITVNCANCGKELLRTPSEIKKNKNNFCSSSCAAIFNNKLRDNIEYREKLSNSLKKYYKLHPEIITERRLSKIKNRKILPKICVICGKEFYPQQLKSGRWSRSTTCSDDCRRQLKQNLGKITYNESVQNGTFKGWQSRNIISYPEQFWTRVLRNYNITFEREKHVGKYFLDFVICVNNKLIDLEIDGKQHKYKDRIENDKIRDQFLISKGYVVYRIDWNEINSDAGKILMKDKIAQFLSFINS